MRFYNVFWGSISRGIFFLITLALSNKLEPTEFSEYGFFIGWVMAVAAVSSYTVSNLLKKDLRIYKEQTSLQNIVFQISQQYAQYSRFILIISLVFSVPIAGIIFREYWLLFIGLSVSASYNLFNAYFAPINQSVRAYNRINSLGFIAVLAAVLTLNEYQVNQVLFIILMVYGLTHVIFVSIGVSSRNGKLLKRSSRFWEGWVECFRRLKSSNCLRLIFISIAVSVVGLPTLMVVQTIIKEIDTSGKVIGYIFLATQFLNVANVVLTKFLQSSIPLYLADSRSQKSIKSNTKGTKSHLFDYLLLVIIMHIGISVIVYSFWALNLFDFGGIDPIGVFIFYSLAVLTSISWFYNELCIIQGKEWELLKANLLWSLSSLFMMCMFVILNVTDALFLTYAVSVYFSRVPSLVYLKLVMSKP